MGAAGAAAPAVPTRLLGYVLQYIFRRLAFAVPVIVGVTLLVYLMIDLAPGDPVSALISPREAGSLGGEWVERERERLGLNQPWPVRYGLWMRELLRGNLGYSMLTGRSVAGEIAQRLGPTLLLAGTALVVSSGLSVLIGVVSAVYQYRWIDHLLTTLSFLFISVPGFFLGLVFIYVFALRLGWLPTGGLSTPGQPLSLRDLLSHLLLPAVVLGASLTAGLARYTRSAMLETLGHDYIVAARAKGLPWARVLFRHALRNALLPVITITGLRIPLLLGGSVVVEEVFNWPGLGELGVLAVFAQDYPVIMALNLLIAVTVVVSNLAADVAYSVVDPRIRYD